MPLVDDQLAAAGARTPVDRPQPIAGDEAARVGELEAVRSDPGDEIARRELGLEWCDEALEELGARVDLQPVRPRIRPSQTSIPIRPRARRRRSPSSTAPQRSQRSFSVHRRALAVAESQPERVVACRRRRARAG